MSQRIDKTPSQTVPPNGVVTMFCSWQMCDWVTAVSAVCEEPISSFLASSLVSLLDPEGWGVGPGHSSLSLLSLLAVDAQLISR